MNAEQTTANDRARIQANRAVVRRLGNWTTAGRFEIRANRGRAVLDLRSPHLPGGDLELDVDLDHAVLRLLVAEDAVIEDWDLQCTGRSRVKDTQGASDRISRRIVLTGQLRQAQVRVNRGGVAMLFAMFSREYLADAGRARRRGEYPTVDDPTRDPSRGA